MKLKVAEPVLLAIALMVAVQLAPDAIDSVQVVLANVRLDEPAVRANEVKVSVTLLLFVTVTVLLPTVAIVVPEKLTLELPKVIGMLMVCPSLLVTTTVPLPDGLLSVVSVIVQVLPCGLISLQVVGLTVKPDSVPVVVMLKLVSTSKLFVKVKVLLLLWLISIEDSDWPMGGLSPELGAAWHPAKKVKKIVVIMRGRNCLIFIENTPLVLTFSLTRDPNLNG
ncbi:MAG: hypothetical protein COW12_02320 [Candidatus Omnitrophica bacterium CG12_big_fil_rev_8_21_14_0_65_45_16]|nr:MAG: hypothetical protein COW12_02320 [Candidatus Omnitrophica bacterium CG12_big_fil_rev_8_21_14_0_65_45_16]